LHSLDPAPAKRRSNAYRHSMSASAADGIDCRTDRAREPRRVMSNRWYKQAVIYSLEVDAYQDSNGDGCGDFQGLISRLDSLSRLGVTALWLNPIHPSPMRDAGYDVSDYYAVDPRLGSLGDFVELCREAEERGIRVLLDLVVNHPSAEPPWFRSARSSPDSPFRDWYVWSDTEPPDRFEGMVFPGDQTE